MTYNSKKNFKFFNLSNQQQIISYESFFLQSQKLVFFGQHK